MTVSSNSITLVYFSPTRTTQIILEEIAKGMALPVSGVIDLTNPAIRLKKSYQTGQGPVIIGAPVYAGRIPIDAATNIKKLNGSGQPAVLVVLYGNREFDDALLELRDIASDCGFVPITGGAFIGEHSFSNTDLPIAVSRPDASDLQKAFEYGQRIASFLDSHSTIDAVEPLSVPGNFPYRQGMGDRAFQFIEVTSNCDDCGVCVPVCPKEAVDESNRYTTIDEYCIFCCACIKACPQEARIFMQGPMKEKAVWLSENCQIRKEPELFFSASFH